MKKFNFTLDKVKNVKETVFEMEKAELAKLQAELHQLQLQKSSLENDLSKKSQNFQALMQRGVVADDLRQFQYMKTSMENQIKTLDRNIARQQVLIEKQLKRVVEADKEVKVLDKLKETQLEEYHYLESKEQEEFILELVSNKISKEASEE